MEQIENKRREAFSGLFGILVVGLMILPVFTTVSEFLTRIVENTFLYYPIERFIVPYEIVLTRTIVSFFGIETIGGEKIFQIIKGGIPSGIYISWNCVGWQSFVILLLSLKSGLSKEFRGWDRLLIVALGLVGTFFLNLFRISLVVLVYYFFGRLPAIILHDYGSVILTVIWLFVFWWFIYSYVSDEKRGEIEDR